MQRRAGVRQEVRDSGWNYFLRKSTGNSSISTQIETAKAVAARNGWTYNTEWNVTPRVGFRLLETQFSGLVGTD
jgi:hypothetical protein